MDKLCRDWSCGNCGSGWLEEVGNHKEKEGKTDYYCPSCKTWSKWEWRIREISDPDEVLDPPSSYCNYCEQLMPDCDMNEHYGNFSHPVCCYCIDEQPIPESLYEVGQAIVIKGSGAGIITDKEYESTPTDQDKKEWVYRVTLNNGEFTHIGDDEIDRKYTDTDADIDGQD